MIGPFLRLIYLLTYLDTEHSLLSNHKNKKGELFIETQCIFMDTG